MTPNAIFIAATGQNVGKTTICLGLIAALKKRFPSVGFIKPVGQQHVQIDPETNIDKDVILFKEHFSMDSEWSDMSPVIFPSGFTRDFWDGKISEESLWQKILNAYRHIYHKHAYTVVEGTGHVAVGSIVNMNNAQVAAKLGLDMVIIASGGLGSAHDELALNLAMCRHYGVKVRGIILNKVLDDKRDMILEYFPKTLSKWGVPLIGCVPYNAFLSNPTIKDFEYLFNTPLLSGDKHRYRHFQSTRLVAGSLDAYRAELIPNELIITPASREDIILATLQKHREVMDSENRDFAGGLILTGRQRPSPFILAKIREVEIPILYAPLCSYDAMKRITAFNAKIRCEDIPKVEQAIRLIEDTVDLDRIACSREADIVK